MTEMSRVADDLRFVRGAVEQRERARRAPAWMAVYWAAYVLVGYGLADVSTAAANWVFIVGGVGGGIACAWASARAGRRAGVVDRERDLAWVLHWCGGFALIVVAVSGLATLYPPLNGMAASQVFIVMVGLLYFLTGAHGPEHTRYLRLAGPVVVVAGVLVGRVPHYGFTLVGVLIAGCILLSLLTRRPVADAPAVAS